MQNKRVVIVVTLILGLLGVSWYLGMQLNQAQMTRAVSFAEYYKIMHKSLRSGRAALSDYLTNESETALLRANLELANVANVARPLVSLVPRGMNGPWSRFMRNDWAMITKSIDKLNERAQYFRPSALAADDLEYIGSLIAELQGVIIAMDAPIVADGAAPGVRLRMDEVEKMSKMVQNVVKVSESYLLNGLSLDEAQVALVSWDDAANIARTELELDANEWKLAKEQTSTIEIRTGRDFYNLRFKPTSKYKGEMKGLTVGVHRQNGKVVLTEWDKPIAKNSDAVKLEELEAWALKATETLPGTKTVYETYLPEDEHPWVVVVRTDKDQLVFTDYAIVGFDQATGEQLKWENHRWDNKSIDWRAELPTVDMLVQLAKKRNIKDINGFEYKGLVVVRSQVTDQPTLCYWLTYQDEEVDEEEVKVGHYFVNARNDHLERSGSGW